VSRVLTARLRLIVPATLSTLAAPAVNRADIEGVCAETVCAELEGVCAYAQELPSPIANIAANTILSIFIVTP
jgi:hypothetical protein